MSIRVKIIEATDVILSSEVGLSPMQLVLDNEDQPVLQDGIYYLKQFNDLYDCRVESGHLTVGGLYLNGALDDEEPIYIFAVINNLGFRVCP